MGIEDVKRVYSLFLDEGRSEQFLTEHQQEYMFYDSGQDTLNLHYILI